MAAMWTSKLGTKYPMEEIQRLDREHHKILERLRKDPDNARCAECGENGTMWASVNLGVFVCTRCADVHRALGTHISKVKGCSGTYLWGKDELASMERLGNARVAALIGASCGASPRPAPEATKEARMRLASEKYDRNAALACPAAVPSLPPQVAAHVPATKPQRASAVLPEPTRQPRAAASPASPWPAPSVTADPVDPWPARSMAANPVDLIDWAAFFGEDSAGSRPAVATGGGAQTPSGPGSEAQVVWPAWPAWSQTSGPTPVSVGDKMGHFWGQQCSSPQTPAPAWVSATAGVGPAGCDAVWGDFGAW
mmetsp:Transcript_45109/g.114395  ORF Transcript_45109/g.114395 Transcript_45109/m.114395 type:complete len:311 (+) Transcript_45109:63-995(+)